MKKTRLGFTLVEVMVALTILAVAFAAGYRALGQSTNNAELLKRRALAQWIAQNQLAQMQINPAVAMAGSGQASQGGIDFIWRAEFTATPNALFRKAEIVVAEPAAPDYQLARLTAYLSAAK